MAGANIDQEERTRGFGVHIEGCRPLATANRKQTPALKYLQKRAQTVPGHCFIALLCVNLIFRRTLKISNDARACTCTRVARSEPIYQISFSPCYKYTRFDTERNLCKRIIGDTFSKRVKRINIVSPSIDGIAREATFDIRSAARGVNWP